MCVCVCSLVSRPNIEADSSGTDGDEDDDGKILERDGIKYPHKSWYFIHNSTIKGNIDKPNNIYK